MTDLAVATGVRRWRAETFASLRVRNYRWYFFGQVVSQPGKWAQTTAQAWLVLQLTGSGTQLGLVVAAQNLPVLLLGPYGGVLADRWDKRRTMIVTQSLTGVFALILGLLVVTDSVRLWEVYLLAAATGGMNVVDSPARQSFAVEMVGPRQIGNAVTLNTIVINLAKVAGPALTGLAIAFVGTGWCFLLNAVASAWVVGAFLALRPAELHRPVPVLRGRGQIREGLTFVASVPVLRTAVIMLALIGCFASQFPVVLPLLAERSLHAGSGGYALLYSLLGLGAVVGGLAVASRGWDGTAALGWIAAGFSVTQVLAALAPQLWSAAVCLFFVGVFATLFNITANATLQRHAPPEFRGRVMSLWTMALLGTAPIGALAAGGLSQAAGARWGLGLGAIATTLAVLVAVRELRPVQPVITPAEPLGAVR
jgi:MFS family permease